MSQLNANLIKRIGAVKAAYSQESLNQHIMVLLSGNVGSGKTTMACTGRRPILLDTFDPGGEKSVQHLVKSGDVFVRDYSGDDISKPETFSRWEKDFEQDRASGFHDIFGTYVIDSLTTFVPACMNAIMAAARRKDTKRDPVIPQIQDYLRVATALTNVATMLSRCKCDIVFTAHQVLDKDESTGAVLSTLNVFKSLKAGFPVMFDEKWVMDCHGTGTSTKYNLLTASRGRYEASTRIGANNVFKPVEEPNLRELLKKAGYPYEDLPRLDTYQPKQED